MFFYPRLCFSTKTPRCVLTDKLSLKINELTDSIKAELWPSTPVSLRARVLQVLSKITRKRKMQNT